MKIIVVAKNKETDITELITDVSWGGDYQQVARTLTFKYVSSASDKNIPVVNMKLGDMVILKDDSNVERFRGYVFTKDKSLSGDTVKVDVYDGLIYLVKSKGTYNFKSSTPKAITQKVARDFNIAIGSLPTGRAIKRIFDGVSIYEIIMTAYTLESNRTGKKYLPVMRKGKLSVIEKGVTTAKYVLDPSETLINANYTESMENSINVVKVYSDKDKYLGEVSIKGVPGRLQDVYKGEGGKTEARGLLQGIEETAGIDALGDFDCITGNAVQVKEKHTGLVGRFFIDSDTHTFKDGNHQMTLGLSFSNIMDSKESGDDGKKK